MKTQRMKYLVLLLIVSLTCSADVTQFIYLECRLEQVGTGEASLVHYRIVPGRNGKDDRSNTHSWKTYDQKRSEWPKGNMCDSDFCRFTSSSFNHEFSWDRESHNEYYSHTTTINRMTGLVTVVDYNRKGNNKSRTEWNGSCAPGRPSEAGPRKF